MQITEPGPAGPIKIVLTPRYSGQGNFLGTKVVLSEAGKVLVETTRFNLDQPPTIVAEAINRARDLFLSQDQSAYVEPLERILRRASAR